MNRLAADAIFERLFNRRHARNLARRIMGKCTMLRSLRAAHTTGARRTYVGLRNVPLHLIRGSEGRERDFDIDFNPLQSHDKSRWSNILIAMRRGESIPPIELIQVGDTYYVRDGHHRVSAARQLGFVEIEAEVTVWE